LNSPDGFIANAATAQWTARLLTVSAQDYQGRLSPFVPVTLPNLDLAFGLTDTSSPAIPHDDVGSPAIAQVAWAYPDARGTQEINAVAAADGYSETMAHRFLRTGGFVYLNAAGNVVALKEISPTESLLGQDPQLSLSFARVCDEDGACGISEAQANTACPVMNPPAGHLDGEGVVEYCWDKSSTIPACSQATVATTVTDGVSEVGSVGTHGCYLFKVITPSTVFDDVTGAPEVVETTNWEAFAVTQASLWIDALHYAGTDQQGAAIASMLTGQHDYMQWAQTREQLGMVTEPRNR